MVSGVVKSENVIFVCTGKHEKTVRGCAFVLLNELRLSKSDQSVASLTRCSLCCLVLLVYG